ncbi:ParB/RepB/Spo0J family partition protein [Nostoc sp. FACHB-888]|jgi:ParB family chromosome partitioning protein|uniref:ParB/RepB/Spo0J family partition protein n=1 Tax=Nostoc sp. FACHB-888 TaxID=2692842 RepID=UPI001689133E|nr:ParB/RepB/Spo0J family partition protein [Nostoc sp. FACHB-888]MBD2249541.1 ParB/RepB/Spo0J family partition protein [Nostoc sp. FACHB-888]MBW4430151.1 ParB/RepB/Spo0J family partition protein [Nostoc desertorum CM1-VF14]
MSLKKRVNQPYEIKGVDALFGVEEAVDNSSAAFLIPIEQIVLPHQQPRRYFAPQAMHELVESIKQHGILQPLLVRPQKDGKYELVAGERRFRGAKTAQLEFVPAVIREMTDVEALELALSENLQREDLNPIEETESIVALLGLKLNQTTESIVALLQSAAHPEREAVDNVIHSQEWQSLLEVFNTIGKFSPESFRTNRLPLLKLPIDVMEALRSGVIEYTKAKVIARVRDEALRKSLLSDAIQNNLSLSQIKERLAEIQANTPGNTDKKSSSLKKKIDEAYIKVKKSKVWDNPNQHKRLQKILVELEALLIESSDDN